MSIATDPPLMTRPAGEFPLQRLTLRQYHLLAEHGVLTEDDDVEFLQGWLVQKMTKSPRHDATIARLTRVLLPLLPAGWMLRVQSAITTVDSEPEPDLAIVRERADDYAVNHPGPGEIGLVIEVADTSLLKDRRKGAIYAAADVPVYWIVNLNQDCVEVYESTADAPPHYQPSRSSTDSVELRLDAVVIGSLSVARLIASRG